MMRLLRIEIQKLWPNRAFRFLSIIYMVAMVIIAMGVMPFLRYFAFSRGKRQLTVKST